MKLWALAWGINKYGSGSDLAGCVNDAQDWSDLFESHDCEVSQLFDKDAIGANIREEIKRVNMDAQPGDVIYRQYSGHGSYAPSADADEEDGNDEMICPVDIFTKGGIFDDELRVLDAQRKPNVKLITFFDSCHSGTATRFAPSLSVDDKFPKRVRFLPPETFLSKLELSKMGRRGFRWSVPAGRHSGLLLSGCLDPEYSYDAWFNGRPNGAFSRVAIDTLKKLPANASFTRWHSAIRKQLPSSDYPQSPNLYGSSTMKRWRVFG